MARSVTILGAGLVGSLLSIILRKRGYEVSVFERRPDMRQEAIGAGRSINLAMSTRGWHALELAGLKDELEALALPMYGRYLHQADGSTAFQPYGRNNEAIYSISRGELNKRLMSLAEQQGATIHFNQRCNRVDLKTNVLQLQQPDGTTTEYQADLLFGADGAFSALRDSYVHHDRVNAAQHYIEHGYKELSIPPAEGGGWRMEHQALHIWPRKNFMLIALPNTDGSFTCTLFFPDAAGLMPTLLEDFFQNPTSSLITTHIFPWHMAGRSALIGDAAHAIVPFYGQGMNAGFEDCSVLSALIDAHGDDWDTILLAYERKRKPNGDAVAELALLNFVEMRDKVADPAFLERKKIEKELGKRYPEQFVSVYEMVSFSHTPYYTALRCIQAQDRLLERIMNEGDFFSCLGQDDFEPRLTGWINEYHQTVQQLQNP
jgi:kynurenine 3-monooxygenase